MTGGEMGGAGLLLGLACTLTETTGVRRFTRALRPRAGVGGGGEGVLGGVVGGETVDRAARH